jgi:hypothetical protein
VSFLNSNFIKLFYNFVSNSLNHSNIILKSKLKWTEYDFWFRTGSNQEKDPHISTDGDIVEVGKETKPLSICTCLL